MRGGGEGQEERTRGWGASGLGEGDARAGEGVSASRNWHRRPRGEPGEGARPGTVKGRGPERGHQDRRRNACFKKPRKAASRCLPPAAGAEPRSGGDPLRK